MKTAFLLVVCAALAMANPSIHFLTQEYHEQINSAQSTWTAGHNPRWDTFTLESLKTQTGTFMDVPPEFQLEELPLEIMNGLPENFDPREQWPGCESLREVRDQSTCGSCWAFGAAEAMSDRICIASGQKDQTRISTEDLLTCCGFSCGMGCNGGYPSGAWSFFKNTGLVTGDLYSNTNWCRSYSFAPCDHHVVGKYGPCSASQPTPKCNQACHKESKREYKQDKRRASSTYSLPNNEQAIMTELFTYGPVEGAFTVYEDFLNYNSGVYQHVTGKQLGGHAIKVLGWGVENGVKYWLCANSWNEGWGNGGFFKILRGSNHCGIEGQMVAGRV